MEETKVIAVKEYGTKGIAEAIIAYNNIQLYKTELQSNEVYVYDSNRKLFVQITKLSNFAGLVVSGIDKVLSQLMRNTLDCTDPEQKELLLKHVNRLKSSSFLRGCKEWFYGKLESNVKLMPLHSNADMNFGGYMYHFTHDKVEPIKNLGKVDEYGKIVTVGCSTDYIQGKEAKVWNEKLADLLPNEVDRLYFQAMMGSAITGHEKRMLIMHTQKNCGKSTIARTINKILTDYAGSGGANMFCKTSQSDNSAAGLSGINALIKQRITIIDEVDNDFKWNVNFIKQVTGGAPVSHKKMFQDMQSSIVHTTPVVWTNHMPVDYTFDDAVKGRIHFLPRFQVVDTNKSYTGINGEQIRSAEDLEDYLVEHEANAIVEWFFEGWKMYVKGEYTVPAQCLEIKEEIEADSRDNVVTSWMSEHGFSVTTDEKSFRESCSLMAVTNFVSAFGKSFGYRATSPTTIKQMLADAGIIIKRKCKNKYIANLIFTNDDGVTTAITKDNIGLLKSLYANTNINTITTKMIDTYLNGTVVNI